MLLEGSSQETIVREDNLLECVVDVVVSSLSMKRFEDYWPYVHIFS